MITTPPTGEGEDGRIKSAVGIGALLIDGIGDTIRVSLTEKPELEIPVALALTEFFNNKKGHVPIPDISKYPVNPYKYEKRKTYKVLNIGVKDVPIVIADLSEKEKIDSKVLSDIGWNYNKKDKRWILTDFAADFIYTGEKISVLNIPENKGQIIL